ncbi:MAG: hydrolase TatD [Candidatus Cloacimonetes bacterium 4572_55]|nr:MAG: hydrolase TatD [Candidatus Cloacimonetes bacterium 4572_55]
MLFDTHTHVNHEKYDLDREDTIQRAFDNRVDRLVEVGFDLPSSEAAVTLARRYPKIYCAIGVHPHDAKTWTPTHLDRLAELAEDENSVAVGEIGLDYHYDLSPRDTQQEVFRTQIRLAQKMDLPIVIHDRDAHEDVMRVLKEENARNVLLHCFSGDLEMAKIALKRGYMLAFGGSLTFKKSVAPDILAHIPLSEIVIETDCPYLTPAPYRGKRNEPSHILYVAKKVAEVKNVSLQEVEETTYRNASRFFRIESEIPIKER